jgi:hypothetical protein
MKRFRQTRFGRLLVPLAPLVVLAAFVGVYVPLALLFAAPWLLGLLWFVTHSPSALADAADEPSMADAALRRLSVR